MSAGADLDRSIARLEATVTELERRVARLEGRIVDGRRELLPIWPDAAQALGIGRTKMLELIQSGEVTTVAIGRRRLVPAEELRSFVERRRGGRT